MSRYIDTLSIDSEAWDILQRWKDAENEEQWECEVITFQLISNSFIIQEKNMTRAEAAKRNKCLDKNSGLGRWEEKAESDYPETTDDLPF